MEESDGMKKILLVATGGTIASVEDGRGLALALAAKELARYVRRSRMCAISTWCSR